MAASTNSQVQSHRDFAGSFIGIIVFLGGIGLLVFVFKLAFEMFTVPEKTALGIEHGKKLDLPAAPGLRSGQFGRVAVPVSEASAIRVPASAVIQRGQMELVFVLASNHAQLRLVKTGSRIGDEIELVSGLDSGEQVVTAGGSALKDGQPVSIKP